MRPSERLDQIRNQDETPEVIEMATQQRSNPEIGCRKAQEHDGHLCRLMEAGRTAEIRAAATGAAYRCGNCQARAADPARLCNPQPLGE
jgi:hypothetical protein